MPPLFHYCKGNFIPYRPNDWKRVYERLIVIDDGGEIGSRSAFCVLTASVTNDVKKFENVIHAFPKNKSEHKHHSSDHHVISRVLRQTEECDIDIYAVSYEKSKLDLDTPDKKKEHLFRQILGLVKLVLENDDGIVFDLMMDNTTLMDGYEVRLVEGCNEIAESCGKKIENIEMRNSRSTKILQIQDFITGAVWAHIEYENDPQNQCHDRFAIIRTKVKGVERK